MEKVQPQHNVAAPLVWRETPPRCAVMGLRKHVIRTPRRGHRDGPRGPDHSAVPSNWLLTNRRRLFQLGVLRSFVTNFLLQKSQKWIREPPRLIYIMLYDKYKHMCSLCSTSIKRNSKLRENGESNVLSQHPLTHVSATRLTNKDKVIPRQLLRGQIYASRAEGFSVPEEERWEMRTRARMRARMRGELPS